MTSRETRRLIERLARKLHSKNKTRKSNAATATVFTGLQSKFVNYFNHYVTPVDIKIEPVDRSVIYIKWVQFCFQYKKLPSSAWELFRSLDIPPYVDIDTFRKLLVKMDFVWKKYPFGAVIIENPVVRFERYNYLKKIQFFRQNGIDIYFVDDNGIDSNGNLMDFKMTILNVSRGYYGVQRVMYAIGPEGVVALDHISDFSEDSVKEWVGNSLLPAVAKPSIFVFKTVPHHSGKILETPTLNSTKHNIMRWLDRHGISYDPDMSKYQLFDLAEKFSDLNKDLLTIDEILSVEGHTVLRIPKCIEYLTTAALMYKAVDDLLPELVSDLKDAKDSSTIYAAFEDLITMAGPIHIAEFIRHISEEEKKMLDLENELDNVMESLLVNAEEMKNKCREDSDLPSCSDSD